MHFFNRKSSIKLATVAIASCALLAGNSVALAYTEKTTVARKPIIVQTTPNTDPAANQVFTIPIDANDPEKLAQVLKTLPETVENNIVLQNNMDSLGRSMSVPVGQVKEITDGSDFGGWVPIDNGKYAIARKTAAGVFPIETINITRNLNKPNKPSTAWLQENSFARDKEYILLLSKVRSLKNQDEETFNGRPYQTSHESGPYAGGVKGFNGIQKTFKAYSPQFGSNVNIEFKTGYTGDIEGLKAKYKVEVITGKDANQKTLYSTTFDPQKNANDAQKVVVAAKDGTSNPATLDVTQKEKNVIDAELAKNAPNGTGGSFSSTPIQIPAGVTDYTVRISSADNEHLGMSYQAPFLQYALPLTGLDFNIKQDTKGAAKYLLQQIYKKLIAEKEADTRKKTTDSVKTYEEKLDAIKTLVTSQELKNKSEYITALDNATEAKGKLVDADKVAIDAITQTINEKLSSIEQNADLSNAEKEKLKAKVEAEKQKAINAINAASDTANIEKAQQDADNAIAKINPIGKENAKKAIKNELDKKLNEINNNNTLSETEKTQAKTKANNEANTQLEIINKQPDTANTQQEANTIQTKINEAKTTAITNIQKVNPTHKEPAKVEMAKKAILSDTGTDGITTFTVALVALLAGIALVTIARKKS